MKFSATLTIDGLLTAGVDGDDESKVIAEIMHYAAMYRDEPWSESFVVNITKRK